MRALVLFLAIGAGALADVVHLKNGGKLEGKVTEEGDRVRVDTGYGSITLRRDEVERIEKKEWKAPERAVFTKSPPRLRSRFAHPFYGFRVYLPAGWAVGASRQAQGVSFYGAKDQLYTPRLDVTIEASRGGVAEMVASLKRAFAKAYGELTFPFEEAFMLGDREAYQFVVGFMDGPVAMRALWTVTAGDGLVYTMGFACTDRWFDRYHARVDASMRSFRRFPPPTAPIEDRKAFDRAYQEGRALAEEGKSEEALARFARAAELLPGYPDVHNVVGQFHARQQNWADAGAAFAKASALDPHDYEFAFNLGVALRRQSKHQEAAAALEKAVKADAAMEPALTELGAAYVEMKQPARAVETLKKAVVADPESASAHATLGLAYERSGKPREAEASYREALKIAPDHREAKEGLARVGK